MMNNSKVKQKQFGELDFSEVAMYVTHNTNSKE
jgi:hypothetical protein